MGLGFQVAYAQAVPSGTEHFLLPVRQDVRTLSFVSRKMPACMLPCFHDDNGLNEPPEM